MPIKLITGLPGSGKSLSAVELLAQAAKDGSGRPIFACGIDGLVDGLAEPLENPLEWESLPDGSLVVVDEAQKYFPARRGETIPPVKALSEHRHRGFDFILVTQHPSMIDPYVRRLVGEHTHVVRKWGSKFATRFRWGEVVEDVQSSTARSRGVETVWRYPKDLYSLYKSATMHTVKRRLPWQLVALPLVIAFVAAVAWYAYVYLGNYSERVSASASDSGKDGKTDRRLNEKQQNVEIDKVSNRTKGKTIQYKDASEYAQMHTPRIASLPWSAPVFDDRRPGAEPEVYCVLIEGKPCRCYTEQVTRYEMEERNCRTIAVGGVYNPYKRRAAESIRAADRVDRPAVQADRTAVQADRTAVQADRTAVQAVASVTGAAYGSPASPAVPGSAWVLGAPRPDQ